MKQCIVDDVPIEYSDSGEGPTIVFVHGVYVTGAVWNDVTAELRDRYRCIAPTWPLGAHTPVGPGPDLGAPAAARRIVHFIDTLDLHDVTIVANDTGGGLVLTALGDPSLNTSRIGKLVFTNSDSYEHFPPGAFRHIVRLCRISASVGAGVLRLLASTKGQQFFLSSVCRTSISPARRAEIFGLFATDSRTRREAVTVTASLDPALTLAASSAITEFSKPVTMLWGADDTVFPLAHAERLADAFPQSRLIEVPGASTYVMIDSAHQVAAAIGSAVDERV